jgi:hypothetical protein
MREGNARGDSGIGWLSFRNYRGTIIITPPSVKRPLSCGFNPTV